MMELIQANWWAFLLALIIGIVVAYWLFVVNRRAKVEIRNFDALEEGAGPAKRNQALIDTPARPEPAVAAPAPAPAATGDDLTRIKGLGPKLAALLNSLGITSFAEIARWSEADIDRIDAQLGAFEGRIRRDSWVEQAKFLAEDDMSGFEGRFGKL
jgi:predicted flap endonuclease-1-like 5' DNA nuclease